jgi:hypothetical protein
MGGGPDARAPPAARGAVHDREPCGRGHWALTALARTPRDDDVQQVAIARRIAGLGQAQAELELARAELQGVDGEWEAWVGEVEALCRRATTARISVSVS